MNGDWGDGRHYDYGFRIYNPAIGKFLSVDPLTKDYPWYTPYQFAGNKPIWAIDLDGLEELILQYRLVNGSVTFLKKINHAEIKLGPGSFNVQVYDKRTGELMSNDDRNKVQYQYFTQEGQRLDIRKDFNGDYVEGENELMDIHDNNWFSNSIYIGPNNPTTPDGGDDYRREPQDLSDAGAYRHDQDYGLVGASGRDGALKQTSTIPADIALVQRSNKIIEMYNEKAIDPYTGEAISEKTYQRAKRVAYGFKKIVNRKAKKAGYSKEERENISSQMEETRDVDFTPSQ